MPGGCNLGPRPIDQHIKSCNECKKALADMKEEEITRVFLGDYVDRGYFGCENVFLLMAMKVTYPDKIHFVRNVLNKTLY